MVTNLDDAGPGSLRAAILTANANPRPRVIEFDAEGTPIDFDDLAVLLSAWTGPAKFQSQENAQRTFA